jgi:hypothetical protein
MAETTVQIECPCGWMLRISGWMAAYKAEQLVAAHHCELVEKEEKRWECEFCGWRPFLPLSEEE